MIIIKNILLVFFIVSIFLNGMFGQNVSIDLNLLETSQFTESNLTGIDGIWYVDVYNEGAENANYRLQYEFKKGSLTVSSGITQLLPLYNEPHTPNQTKRYTNIDLKTDNLNALYENLEFKNDIENSSGYLPPGSYTLTVRACKYGTNQDIATYENGILVQTEIIVDCDSDNNCGCIVIDDDIEEMEVPLGDGFGLVYPDNGQQIPSTSQLAFQFNTPGFREDVKLEFRLLIAAITNEIDNASDAINIGSSSVYYFPPSPNSGWDLDVPFKNFPQFSLSEYIEDGISQTLYFSYTDLLLQADFEELICGYNYAWRIETREVIDSFGGEGIYGWPESVVSETWEFTFGQQPDGLNISSTDNVLPTFSWDDIWCADQGYEIEIIESNSSQFNSFIFSDLSTLTFYNYKSDNPGLVPGKVYSWRVRTNSISGLTPWSNSSTFQINDIELIEPTSGTIIETVRPIFDISAPENIGHFTLMIGFEDDENVVVGEVYNQEQQITSFPWQYPSQDIENGLYPGMVYFWKYIMYDNSEVILGDFEDYDVAGNFRIMPIILNEPANGASNVSLNPKFEWSGPTSVPKYEFWLSKEEDPELNNPDVIIEIVGTNFFEYPNNADLNLDYEKKYYWRIVPKDINNNYAIFNTSSTFSDIYQFTALDFPVMGESIEESIDDPRVPIININTISGVEYSIIIFSDSDGNSKIEEITGITNFPYKYSQGIENFEWGKSYYFQIQPYRDGDKFGPPSNILNFDIPQFTQQCEFVCTINDENIEPEILTTILEGIEGATEYLLLVSNNEDMAGATEIIISSGQSEYVISSEYVEWGQTYYTQIIAQSEGEDLGIPSEIQTISIEGKPGMDEQTALSVSLKDGSKLPNFEIINEITGANGYRIILSKDQDITTILWEYDLYNSTNLIYPDNAPALEFGQSYYIVAQALIGDELHGIISSIVAIYIPNITPPILEKEFIWESTIPKSDEYLIEVSLVEDFSVPIISKIISETSYKFDMEELEFGKGYYWRVQGISSDGNKFGNSSQVKFFKTEDIPPPEINNMGEEVSTLPEFSWVAFEFATSYEIVVSGDSEMQEIFWNEKTENTSIKYPETAIKLSYASTYYWKLISLDENGKQLSESAIESFSTNSIYPVEGLSPNGGIEDLAPILEWDINSQVSSYFVSIATDSEMQDIIQSFSTNENSQRIIEGILKQGTIYYWMVDGLNDNEESLAGPSSIAQLVTPSLNSITLLAPIEGNVVSNLTPTFKWSALQGAEYYLFKLGIGDNMDNIIYENTSSNTEIVISEEQKLSNAETYSWQIEATGNNGEIIEGNNGKPGVFITSSLSSLSIIGLEDGEVISISNPLFSWQADEDIAAFSIRFADNSDFNDSWSYQVGSTNFEYPNEPKLNYDKSYYWQVIPLDNEGNIIGNWTQKRSFSINAAFNVELGLPENGIEVTTINPTFEWNKINNAVKYEIQVASNEDISEIIWSSIEIVENNTKYPSSGVELLEYDQVYYWRVRALGEDGALGDFSNIFSFKLSAENTVKLEGPLEQSESLLPYFSWSSIKGASSYLLRLSSDESISTIIYTGTANDVFIQYSDSSPPLKNGLKYYWDVVARDANDKLMGDPSEVGSFSTPKGFIEIQFKFE